MGAVLPKHGVAYRLGPFQTGQRVGEWMVVVQYADWMAYAKAQDSFAQDPEHGIVVSEIAKIVTLIGRELVAARSALPAWGRPDRRAAAPAREPMKRIQAETDGVE